jgi:hypothetical protein
MKNKFSLHEAAAEGSFVLQNQRPGKIVNGKFVQINVGALSAADRKKLESDLSRYAAERERKFGKGQLQKDLQTSQRVAKEQEAKRKAEAEAKAKAQKPATTPAKPATTTPAAPSPAPARPSGTTPAPAPAPARPSGTTPAPAPAAPKPSPVAAYMKAAADARKSGDPAQMAKVRDMGMDIWRKSNPKLAAAADERARIRGTAQTDNPLMKDMRGGLSLTPSVQAPAVKNLGSGQQSLSQNPNAAIAATPKPQVPPVTVSKDATMNKSADELSKNPLKKQEVKKEAYDIVLDYLLSEGHADTLSEAHYVMLQMDAEHIQNIVIQERAWWDPAGLFMTKNEKAVEKAKSTATGSGGSYNPNTGRTYNPTAKDQTRATGVIAPRGGIVGTMEPGKPETWQRYAPGSDAFRRQNIDRYVTVRGRDQIIQDGLKNRAMKDKAKRDAAADAAFDRKYGVNQPSGDEFAGARKNTKTFTQPSASPATPRPSTRPSTRPAAKPIATAPKPKPQPPTIQSKNVTSTGTSYERRTPTSAELAAAKAAGGGEAGVKAAVDVAKSNKVAAKSPTPDLKPEAPKKRESLAAQVKELQTMRKEAEERNK